MSQTITKPVLRCCECRQPFKLRSLTEREKRALWGGVPKGNLRCSICGKDAGLYW